MSGAPMKAVLILPLGPGMPAVSLDGLALRGLVAATLDHDPQSGTVLHLALAAEVECRTAGVAQAGDPAAPGAPQGPAGEAPAETEWETVGAAGPYRWERNRQTGEQRRVLRARKE